MKLKRDPADAAFSDCIRERDGYICANCQSGDRSIMQCAHITSRKFSSTRTDPKNAVCLCSSCHATFTQDPFLWVDWCRERFGSAYIDLLRMKRHRVTTKRNKLYVKACAAHYRNELKRIKLLSIDGITAELEEFEYE